MQLAYVLQCALILVMAALVLLWRGPEPAVAALYGGAVALANVGMLVWRWRRGRYDYHCDGHRHLRQFHRSMLERFFVVGIMLATGIGGLNLEPLMMLLGFIVGQCAWMVAAATLKTD
ncbi:MAG: ATP synthase subunit I [Pseudomonadota bacterium]|nr:ATP synthase subunit I [Pseudomonadota bacterium]MDP1906085.1 ATP synthase subunit I [Pseudomonadota bacterium]MDP2353161.1 ATP synthase subunit I [Pseudomonadota bacterium]